MVNNKIVTGDRLEYFKNKLANVAISNDYNDLDNKLVAGENITISDTNVISASGGGSITVDDTISVTSTNPVQNKVIEKYLEPVLGVPKNDRASVFNFNNIPENIRTAGKTRNLLFAYKNTDGSDKLVVVNITLYKDSQLTTIASSEDIECSLELVTLKQNYGTKVALVTKNLSSTTLYKGGISTYCYNTSGQKGSFDPMGIAYFTSLAPGASISGPTMSGSGDLAAYYPYCTPTLAEDQQSCTMHIHAQGYDKLAENATVYLSGKSGDSVTIPISYVFDNLTFDGEFPKTPWEKQIERIDALAPDKALSLTSENSVQNKAITTRINSVRSAMDIIIGPEGSTGTETVNIITSNGQIPPTYDFASEGYTDVLQFIIDTRESGYNHTGVYALRFEIGFKFNEGSETSLSNFDFSIKANKGGYIELDITPVDGSSHTLNMVGLAKVYKTDGSVFSFSRIVSTISFNKTFSTTQKLADISWGTSSYYDMTIVLKDTGYAKFFASLSSPSFTHLSYAGQVVDWLANFTFNGSGTPSPWKILQDKVTLLGNDKQDLLTAGDGITIDENNVISASGSGEQVQVDWNQIDDTAVDFIKNKPTIPVPVTVDEALSMTSVNPVQNKVISSKLSTVLGVPTDPSDQPINFSFSQELPIHQPTDNYILKQFFLTTSNNVTRYYEVLITADFNKISDCGVAILETGKYGTGSADNLFNSLAIWFKNESASNTNGSFTMYWYDTTGTQIGSISKSINFISSNNITVAYMCHASNYDLALNYITKASGVGFTFDTFDADYAYNCSKTHCVSVPVLNYTINGEIPKTPWEEVKEKVDTLENTPIATTSVAGKVIPDGTTIAVDGDGVISFNDEIKSETFNLTDTNGGGGEGTITIYQWYKFCWSEIAITKPSSSSDSRFVATGNCTNISVPSGKAFSLLKDIQEANINGMIGGIDGATQISLIITGVTSRVTLATDVTGLINFS